MRPTRAVAGMLLLVVVLHQLTRLTGVGWLALAAGACLALPVSALLLRPRLDALDVRSGPCRARVGEPVELHLVVRNTGVRPTPPVRLTDRTAGLAAVVVAVPALAAGAEVTAVVRRDALRRGWTERGAIELSSAAPFGMLRSTRTVEPDGPFVVGPARLTSSALPDGGDGSAAASRPLAGSGHEVLGLRAWRPGDGARAVSARASARHGRPVVLERERDTGAAFVVLCTGRGAGPVWETVVARSCALAEQALRQGRPVTLLAAGLPAVTGRRADAVVDWHARLDAAQPVAAGQVDAAVRTAGRGGALVLLAPPPVVPSATQPVRRACAAAGARLLVLGAG